MYAIRPIVLFRALTSVFSQQGVVGLTLSYLVVLVLLTPGAPWGQVNVPRPVIDPLGSSRRLSSSRPLDRTLGDFLVLAAEFDTSFTLAAAFGDSDHDGLCEIVFRDHVSSAGCKPLRWYEYQPDGTYLLVQSSPCVIPFFLADLDGDGLEELVGQVGGYLQVFESTNPNSHPSGLVWTSQYLSNVIGDATWADTDADGVLESIFSRNGFGGDADVLIFESAGNDSFELKYSAAVPGNPAIGEQVVSDLDGDGRVEIAVCGLYGWVHIFEAVANDTWTPTWSFDSGLLNAYGAEGGLDTDGNGTPELFIMGNDSLGSWTTLVFESTDDDIFETVATISFSDGFSGAGENALGNLDGVGAPEYVMDVEDGLRFYRPTSSGVWELVDTFPDPGDGMHHGLFSWDTDGNGRKDLIWLGPPVMILQHPLTTSDVIPEATTRARLVVTPNPVRDAATVFVRGASAPGEVSVFDVAGKFVGKLGPVDNTAVRWETSQLPSGVYLLRFRGLHGGTTFGRVLVLR